MNVGLANLLFDIANLLFIAGSTALIIDFVRKPFKYKLWSVSLTLSAMLVVQLAYLNLDNFLSVLLSLPTVVYWAMATGYCIYKSLKERIGKKRRKFSKKIFLIFCGVPILFGLLFLAIRVIIKMLVK